MFREIQFGDALAVLASQSDTSENRAKPSCIKMPVIAKAIETVPLALALHELPRLQKSLESSFTYAFTPVSASPDSDVIEFDIPEGDYYIDPSEISLYMKCQIVHTNKKTVTASPTGKPKTLEEEVAEARAEVDFGACNNLFHLLFDKIDVQINGIPMANSTYGDNGLKAFFYILFNYSACVKDTFLQSILWYMDTYTGANIDERDLSSIRNYGAFKRFKITGKETVFELMGRPMHDFFMVNKYYPPKLHVRIKFFRKNPEFCLVSNKDDPQLKIKLTDVKLNVRMVKPTAHREMQMHKELQKSPALYTVDDSPSIKTCRPDKGTEDFTFKYLFGDRRLPTRVILP